MIKRYFLFQCIFPGLIACSSAAYGASITWVAQSPNNDMDDSANWNPNTIPGSGDTAIFNSAILGIETNPTENFSSFSVSTFNFPNNASVFEFNFNNNTLTFNGIGITGSNKNPFITATNTNNSSFLGDLISFLGGTGTSGSSIITSSNSGTLTGVQFGAVGSINSNLYSAGAFIIAGGGNIIAHNTGNDSTNGTGNNGIANTGSSQLRFDQSFTAGDNVAVSVSNNGTFSGMNTVQGNAVAIVNGSQFISLDAFEVGDNFNCALQNTGNDSSFGIGLCNIGQLNAAQMILQTTGTVGDNCTIALSNTGINSSQTTTFSDFIGYLNDQQFFVGNTFQAGDNFSLTASNTGTDTSNGYGTCQVAVINSNSGTTGNQILFQQGLTLGDHATISASNNGTYSGTNTNGGSNVAGMNLQQIVFGDSSSPGSYSCMVGDYFSLSAFNSGIDSGNGIGSDAVGSVSTDQIALFTPVILGDNANITITNSGNFSGDASATYVNVGSIGGSQLNCESSFSAGTNFTLNVSNSGTNTGSGVGSYFIGDLIGGEQVTFQDSFVVGNHAAITISNSGASSSNTTFNNQVGSLMGYGKQLLAKNQFQIGDDFILEITNSGFDDSVGPGGNFVGFMNNNTVDNSGSQLHLADGGTVGDRASITLSNTGTYQGINTGSGNFVGALSGQQLYSVNDFQTGNNFELTVSNLGIDNASDQSNNNTGLVGSSQVQFGAACVFGNNASFVLTNSGTNNDATGSFNNIGFVNGSVGDSNGSQIEFDDAFSAIDGLQMTITNQGTNHGNGDFNYVGNIVNAQLYTTNLLTTFNAGSNATINLTNTGVNSGSGTPFSFVGSVTSQAQFNGAFSAIDGLQLMIINQGTNNDAGTNNFVGYVANSQLFMPNQTTFSAGSNATIIATNTGTGIGNLVGYVGGQVLFGGNFSALDNLVLIAANNGTGTVANNQIMFAGDFSALDNLVLTATNSETGIVQGTQIVFNGECSFGKCATVSAINNNSSSLVNGIVFSGASAVTGGDVLINLTNSSLNIATGSGTDPFTMSGLNGNAASSMTSNQNLIIGLTDSCITSATFGGSIGGFAGMTLTKNGTGIQTLSGINTYTGLTLIQKGVLSITGSLVGDVTVSSGGTLKGTGTIGGIVIIENGGTLFPGNSIGTINLGSLALNSGSTTVIEIDPNASSSIHVTGSASVDGALQIIRDEGAYPHKGSYLILSADLLNGTFSSINTLPGFTFNLSYLGNDIYLNYLLAISTKGLSGNSLKLVKHLNAKAPPLKEFVTLAGFSGDSLNRALKSISPARNAFATYITAQIAFSLNNLVSSHLDELKFFRQESSQDDFLSALTADSSDRIVTPVRSKGSKNKFSAWVSGFGEFAHQSASLQNPSFNFISEAILTGLDYRGENKDVLGGSLGYAHTHYYEDNHAGHGNINYYFASVYGNAFIGDFYLSPAAWGIFSEADNTRHISFSGFSKNAHADIFAWQFVPYLEAGYDMRFSWGDIIPFTSANWAISWQRGYTEHGASPFNAKQKANNSSMVRSETGLKFCEKWEKSWGAFFVREKASYIFEKPFGTGTVNTAFVGMPGAFTVTAVNQNLNLGSIGLNFLVAIGKEKPVKLDFGYEGEFGSNYWSNELMLTISKSF